MTHVPYRSWYNHCDEGRGREAGHSRHNNEGQRVSTVSFDYAFVGDKGEITSQEQADTEEGSMKIFVVRDLLSKAVFGHVVPKNGLDENGFAVDTIVGDIKRSGYTKVMLQSDNKPAILKLLFESFRELRTNRLEQVMSENSPEYDPQANGNAEIGVNTVKGMLRTHRSNLETELGYRVPARHPFIITWFVRHSSMLLNWTVVGPDGISAYNRVRSKPFETRLLRFEACSCKIRAQEPLSSSGDGRRWHAGISIGVD